MEKTFEREDPPQLIRQADDWVPYPLPTSQMVQSFKRRELLTALVDLSSLVVQMFRVQIRPVRPPSGAGAGEAEGELYEQLLEWEERLFELVGSFHDTPLHILLMQ